MIAATSLAQGISTGMPGIGYQHARLHVLGNAQQIAEQQLLADQRQPHHPQRHGVHLGHCLRGLQLDDGRPQHARAHRQQTELAVSRLAKDAEARCAEWLLRHAEATGTAGGLTVNLRERKRTIASQLGIAPETFSRVLRHLRERQLISGAGRVLGLPNPQALRELAGV